MRRYTREEMLEQSGAQPEELSRLEAQRLLVPFRRWRLFGRGSDYYTEGQLRVLQGFVKAQRAVENSRRPRPQPNDMDRRGMKRSGTLRSATLAGSHDVDVCDGPQKKENEHATTATKSAHHPSRKAGVDG